MKRAPLSPLLLLIGVSLFWACDLSPQPLPPHGDNGAAASGGSSGSTVVGGPGGSTSGGQLGVERDASAANDASEAVLTGGDGGGPSFNEGDAEGATADASGDGMSLDADAGLQDAEGGPTADAQDDGPDAADAVSFE